MINDIIKFEDFLKIKICVGKILSIDESNKLKHPSFIVTIDFGPKIGIKKSSAKLKVNYKSNDLLNKQILAVVNFYPKQIGNIMSEVLILGLPDKSNEPILISPDIEIENGKQLY